MCERDAAAWECSTTVSEAATAAGEIDFDFFGLESWDALDLDIPESEMDKLFASCPSSADNNLALLGNAASSATL